MLELMALTLLIAAIADRARKVEAHTDELRLEVLGRALDAGLCPAGGECGATAIAINKILFDGKGRYIAAFNGPLWNRHGHFAGHVAVMDDRGIIWDAEGTFEGDDGREEFRAWGMVSHENYEDFSITEEEGLEAEIAFMDDMLEGLPNQTPERLIRSHLPSLQGDSAERILREALEAALADRASEH